MSRSIGRDDVERNAEADSSFTFEGLSRSGGGEGRSRETNESEPGSDFGENRRERVLVRGREYRVRPSEEATLRDLGTFRLIRDDDLVKGVYKGDGALAQADVRALKSQGLIETFRFQSLKERGGDGSGPVRVHMLSGGGHRLLEARSGGGQFWYFGAVKRTEVEHESLLYRAYLRERGAIELRGGSVKRVLLDTALVKEHLSKTNKPNVSYRKVQAESARELHLPVVDGHVVFPDFRIEYENERGEPSRSDVEVATGDYRGKHLSMKAAAGFRVYATPGRGGGVQVQYSYNLKAHAFPRETPMVLPL